MDQAEKYDRIERFLAGSLTGIELVAFETAMREDPALREEVALHREAMEALGEGSVHAFRVLLREVDAGWEKPEQQKKGRILPLNLRWIAGVAAALLLLISAYFLFRPQPTSAELFAVFFEPYPMVLSERGATGDETDEALLNEAMAAYSAERYGEAAAAFGQLAVRFPGLPAYRYYAGVSALSAGDPEAAVAVLEPLADEPGHFFREQSRWYLGMAHLRLGDLTAARSYLEAIRPGEFQYGPAGTLLEEMGR